jgi:hypothetical protein
VTDTLTDLIEAHEALAEAAMQHLSLLDVEVAKGIMLGDPLARHIAANDPATIEAFCAVAKAAGGANDYFQATAPCQDKSACHACSEQAICQMVDALHKSVHALYDALGGE